MITTALELFERQGYEATTMDDIAGAAGISRRTLFRYASTKADLVFDHQWAWRAVFRQSMAQRAPAEPLIDALKRTSRDICAHVAADPQPALVAFRLRSQSVELAAHAAGLERMWRDEMRTHIEREWNVPPGDLAAAIVAAALIGMIATVLENWAAAGGATDMAAELAHGFELLGTGIGALDRHRRVVPRGAP